MTENAKLLCLAIVNQSHQRLEHVNGLGIQLEPDDLPELFSAIGRAYVAEGEMKKLKGWSLPGLLEQYTL